MVQGTAFELMRIVAHNGARIWGGAERATVLLLRGLQERGHHVHLLCNDPLVEREAIARGVPASLCPVGGDVAIPHAFRISRRLRQLRPDAFIVGTWKKLFLASLGARLARTSRIVARVGLETDTPRSAKYRYALRHWVHGVAVNAERMIAPFESLTGFGVEKVRLIHNGVRRPARSLPAGSLRSSLGIPDEAFVVGTLSRLARQKRLDRLLDAVAIAPPGIHVIVAGDGEERDALDSRARMLAIGGRVHFVGHREDTGDVLDAFDCLAITSDREGLSNSMLEAMSASVPIITTPVSGATDAIDGDEPAGLITGFDPASIASAIARLAEDTRLRAALAAGGAKRAREKFSLAVMLDSWEAFLAPRRTRAS